MANYCGSCGAKLRTTEAKFCSECGSKVISSPPMTTGEQKVQNLSPEKRTESLNKPQTSVSSERRDKAAEISSSTCAQCHGTGFINETNQVQCSGCGGTGWIRKWEHPLSPGSTFPQKPPTMVTTPCTRCGGRGYDLKVTRITCPACRGRGG